MRWSERIGCWFQDGKQTAPAKLARSGAASAGTYAART